MTDQLLREERWRPVLGWEGIYSVSDQGRVRSESRAVTLSNGHLRRISQKLLSPTLNRGNGRVVVVLCGGPELRVHRGVHRLVLEAFVGLCPEGMECLHWDDDGSNNTLENLRWGTRSDNLRDAARNGRHPWANRTHCPYDHPYDEENTFINCRGSRECRTCIRTRNRSRSAVAS